MTISTMTTEQLLNYAERHASCCLDTSDKDLINELVKRLQGKNVVPINKDLPEILKHQSGSE